MLAVMAENQKPEPAEPGRLVELDYPMEPPASLVDVGHVNHGPELFAVMLGEASPFDRNAKAKPRVSFCCVPSSYFGIVAALASNWNKWAAANLGAGSPRFRLINADQTLD